MPSPGGIFCIKGGPEAPERKSVMKRFVAVLLVAAALLFQSAPADAKIVTEADNQTNKITFRTFDNVGDWGIKEYSVMKVVNKDEIAEYFLRLSLHYANSSYASRILLDDQVTVIIDRTEYKIDKITNGRVPPSYQSTYFYPLVYYRIPWKIVSAMNKAESITFIVTIPTKPQEVINMNNHNLEELRKIIRICHFSNYLENPNNKSL